MLAGKIAFILGWVLTFYTAKRGVMLLLADYWQATVLTEV